MVNQAWEYNGWFGGSREVYLTVGQWDENAVDVFSRGHCHSLALAMLELLPDAELYGAWEQGELQHVFIRTADGEFIDANGIQEEWELTDGWIDPLVDWLVEDDIEDEVDRGHFRRARTYDAVPFARALLDACRIKTTDELLAIA